MSGSNEVGYPHCNYQPCDAVWIDRDEIVIVAVYFMLVFLVDNYLENQLLIMFLKLENGFGGRVKENNDAGVMDRQDWIDFAKGIGIILVVWAHTRGFLTEYIVQFHMPMFFLFQVIYTNTMGG